MPWISRVPQAIVLLHRAADQAVRRIVDDLRSTSQSEVPKDTRALMNSASATTATSGHAAMGAVAYDTPYAVIQHQRGDFAHDDGKAFYLADPLERRASAYQAFVADAVRRNLG